MADTSINPPYRDVAAQRSPREQAPMMDEKTADFRDPVRQINDMADALSEDYERGQGDKQKLLQDILAVRKERKAQAQQLKEKQAKVAAPYLQNNGQIEVIKRPADNVSHPEHYTSHPSGVECIQITEHFSFCIGNAMKYLWRADLKHNSIEDLRKARFYVEREIELRMKQGG